MLLAIHRGILHILINDIGKLQTVVPLHLLRTKHAMVEEEIERNLRRGTFGRGTTGRGTIPGSTFGRRRRWRPNHLIIMIARNQGIAYRELRKRILETESRRHSAIKRIKLSNGTTVNLHITTMHEERREQGIAQLAIMNLHLGRINHHAPTLVVMDRRILQEQLLTAHITRIHLQRRIGTMNIGIGNLVVIGRRHQLDALPLTRSAVVRQIREHVVQSVAPHHYLPAHLALHLERAVDLYAGILMEKELRASTHSKRSHAVYTDTTIHHHRLSRLEERIAADPGITHHQRIPGIGIEIHLLLHPTLQGEHQVILHLPGRILMLRVRGKFDEDTDAITLPHLHILSLIARRLAQIRSIHIDTEARLIAVLQPHRRTAQALACTIIHPERGGRRRHIGKRGIERYGIYRKREHIAPRRRETLVFRTSRQHRSRQRSTTYYIKKSLFSFHIFYKTKKGTYYCILLFTIVT